jgi:hypothetical protein
LGQTDIRLGSCFIEQELADLLGNDTALFRMAHDRVTQIQCPRVHSLDAFDSSQNRPALLGAAQVAREHSVAVAQLANVGNTFHQRRNLRWSEHFARPLAILSVIGKLYGI